MIELREARDHINFLRACALIAHNFGDLDRVIEQWKMPEDNAFRKRIFKLGHQKNEAYPSSILPYAGQVNKRFLAVENHRHMSMRQPKCLRRSSDFLIPIGPFMREWGKILGQSSLLSLEEKGEIVAAYFEGYKRQNQAFGYARAYGGMLSALPKGIETLAPVIAFDVMAEIKKSDFTKIAERHEDEFLSSYKKELENFTCPVTGFKF
ncbi:MAG: hypothetical protein JNM93_14315, partial [Bacteriovoracaceae bacterium]|nr:hypothetical protein [Bacteriovoracaceae bacterium]